MHAGGALFPAQDTALVQVLGTACLYLYIVHVQCRMLQVLWATCLIGEIGRPHQFCFCRVNPFWNCCFLHRQIAHPRLPTFCQLSANICFCPLAVPPTSLPFTPLLFTPLHSNSLQFTPLHSTSLLPPLQ